MQHTITGHDLVRLVEGPLNAIPEKCKPRIMEAMALCDEDARQTINRDIFDRNRYYAIHASDIAILPSLVRIIAQVLSDTDASAKLVIELFMILRRYHKRRIKLTAEEGIILMTLKTIGPGPHSPISIANTIQGHAMSAQKVESILLALMDVQLPDNSRTSFVGKNEHGYFANDL